MIFGILVRTAPTMRNLVGRISLIMTIAVWQSVCQRAQYPGGLSTATLKASWIYPKTSLLFVFKLLCQTATKGALKEHKNSISAIEASTLPPPSCLTSWNSKVPSVPPASQNKAQIGLNQALFGPCFGMGGGLEGSTLEFLL